MCIALGWLAPPASCLHKSQSPRNTIARTNHGVASSARGSASHSFQFEDNIKQEQMDASRKVSGALHATPQLPNPVTTSQENTEDVMSLPIISDDAQSESQENTVVGTLTISRDIPLVIGDKLIGTEMDLPETPEGRGWSPSSRGAYILAGVIPDESQPFTSDQKPVTSLQMIQGIPLLISSSPECEADGTDDSHRVTDESESFPDESQSLPDDPQCLSGDSQCESQEYDGDGMVIAVRWATNEIKCIDEAARQINAVHAAKHAASQSSAMPLQHRPHSEIVESITVASALEAPKGTKRRALQQPDGD